MTEICTTYEYIVIVRANCGIFVRLQQIVVLSAPRPQGGKFYIVRRNLREIRT